MHQLPRITAFDAASHPALGDIFRSIDAGIAAIVAADPAFRAKPVRQRRQPSARQARRGRVAPRTAA